MANRERKNELKIYLSDKEQYILEQKVKISGMKSKSTFLRRLILYGFVYDIDYSDLRDYNATLGKISGNLNQIAKRMNATGNVYKSDAEEVKKTDETSVGYTKVHAFQTAKHEAIIPNGIPSQNRIISVQIFYTYLQRLNATKPKIRQFSHH